MAQTRGLGAAETSLGLFLQEEENTLLVFQHHLGSWQLLNPILNASTGMGAHKGGICTAGAVPTLSRGAAPQGGNSRKISMVPWVEILERFPWMGSGVSVPSQVRQSWDEHPELCLGWWEGAATRS